MDVWTEGSGFLYARPELHGSIDPGVVSWDWQDGASFTDVHRWQGTRDPSAYLAVPAAIEFQESHDWPTVRERCHRLLERARERLPLEPLTDRFVQMLGFRIDHPEAEGLTRRLYEEHRVEVPVFESAGGWVLRVSARPTTARRTSMSWRKRLHPSGSDEKNPYRDDLLSRRRRLPQRLPRFLRRSEEAARQVGITPGQHMLLLQIAGSDEEQTTVSELVEKLSLTQSAVTGSSSVPSSPGSSRGRRHRRTDGSPICG